MSRPALWTAAELVAATGGRPVGTLPASIAGISIDTRSVEPGDAFFAIRGERLDGHAFLRPATVAGATLLVVSEQKLPALGAVGAPLLVVDDVLVALERLAAAARARTQARIAAVTGSVGKTTTKDALRHVLEAQGEVHASAASFNNHWGVPLSLARLPREARFAVFEIGMNHPGEIRPLVKLVRPHVALVTLIAPAHLGHFRDLAEIAEAKAEIFEGLGADGTAVVNADDPMTPQLSEAARRCGVRRVATFGEATDADYRLDAFEPSDEGSDCFARIDGTPVEIHLGSPGRHLAQNVLAVLGVADLLGADAEAGAASLGTWRAGRGRGARLAVPLGGGEATLIDESYNANPASMRAALLVLKGAEPSDGGRRVAALGDMLELGTRSGELHAGLADAVLDSGADALFLAGPEMRALAAAAGERVEVRWHPDARELGASLRDYLRPGDVLMMKASKSIGFYALADDLARGVSAPGEAPPSAPAHSSVRQGA